ncbi:MAG: phosphatidylglycerophosphatase A [Cyclobacteriaceae bacterium]|nr:phosphatidylglycerophosphatase A [Cyclobacteriaceae bacterium]
MIVHKLIASCCGVGYIKRGSGSVAALIVAVLWFFFGSASPLVQVIIAVGVTIIGIWSAYQAEAEWGHDSSRIVIDEAAGMLISMFIIPITWKYVLAAFLLFRFFDILKPLFIKKMERLKGGWGVMMDDVLAGIYTNVILQILVVLKVF